MPFEPDIIVTVSDPPHIALVVEVRLRISSFARGEKELKGFMVRMRCPVGMLVTPDWLWLYRDEYLSLTEDSVRLLGKFNFRDVLRFVPSGNIRRDNALLERQVQAWIESLGTQSELDRLPKVLREVLREEVVPLVSAGVVSAAHPRPALSA